MEFYYKQKIHRTRMIIFIMLCAISTNIMLPISVSASELQPIMGETIATKEEMVEYYRENSPTSFPHEYTEKDIEIEGFLQIILEEANAEGVRADVVFAQILVETDWLKFNDEISIAQNNFGGLKDQEGNYLSFDSIEEGIRANIQLLKGYASSELLKQYKITFLYDLINPKGMIAHVEDLGNGNWSVNPEYGKSIRKHLERINDIKSIATPEPESEIALDALLQTEELETLVELEEPQEIVTSASLETKKERTSKPKSDDIIPVEVKTLSIDGSGYVGSSHRIRSFGRSENGVLYQFWIKDLSINKWIMIQDYSKSSASWTPIKSGKYLYGVHIKDEKSSERFDAHLYKEITIKSTEVKTLSIDGSGYVGSSHRIRSYGQSNNGVLYQFWIKDLSTKKWTMIKDYSKGSAVWTPIKPGKYIYGVHIKDEKSNKRLDAHLYKEVTIKSSEVKILSIDGPCYVGGSHRIRSSGESANGVLYQFWIKDLGANKWTMIKDYSKSSAVWIPTKEGKYLYGVHIKDEKSNARLDTHLYEEITIKSALVKSLNIQGSGYIGNTHLISSYGDSLDGTLYQFWIKDLSTNKWTMLQDYKDSNSLMWIPTKAGKYLYGVHIKDIKSNEKLDDHLYLPIHIEKNIVDKALETYKESRIDYRLRMQDYDMFGDYLNYGKTKRYVESSKISLDEEGIPKVRYGEEFYYNPVTVAQYALMKYGQYIGNNEETSKLEFLAAVDKLLETQDETGAFRYDFTWKYYLTGEYYEPGWVSGMAQGQALNVLARAYYLTDDAKYLDAGNKAVEFLITEVEEGGTKSNLGNLDPSLRDYIFFEEYVSTPNNYTLNGYMFTLLGLYDWKVITNTYQPEEQNQAEKYYKSGIKTLEIILPYYDIGGFSAYDLGHLTFNKEPHIGVSYHAVHINLLHALDSIENNETLKRFEELWKSYVDNL